MSNDNRYYLKFKHIIKDFDVDTKVDVTKAFTQSISDFDLENSDFDKISKQLGSPNEFVEEYIKEKGDRSITPSILGYIRDKYNESENGVLRMQISFKIVLIMQILTIIMIPALIPFQERTFLGEVVDRNVDGIIADLAIYLAMMLVLYLTVHISTLAYIRKRPSKHNYGLIYYKLFKTLIFIIFASGFSFLGWRIESFFENVFGLTNGSFLMIVFLPVTLMSALKSTAKRGKISLENAGHTRYYDTRSKKLIFLMRNAAIIFAYFNLFNQIGYSFIRVGYSDGAEYIFITWLSKFSIIFILEAMAFATIFVLIEYRMVFSAYPELRRMKIIEMLKIYAIMAVLVIHGQIFNLIIGGFWL